MTKDSKMGSIMTTFRKWWLILANIRKYSHVTRRFQGLVGGAAGTIWVHFGVIESGGGSSGR